MKKSKPYSINLGLNGLRAFTRHSRCNVLLVVAFLFVPLLGCAKKVPVPHLSLSETQKRFETKCRDDFDMHVTTRQVGQTIYVYLPTDKPLFDYEAQKEKTDAATDKKEAKFNLNYIDGKFDNNNFAFEYDITDRKKSNKEDYGYTSSYSDSYTKQQNNLFVAISDTFFDNKPIAGEAAPEFMVIIVTDIKKGIESRSTFYLQDFKRYMSGDLPYEEYMKRFIPDTKGGQSFIGDEIGTHIEYVEIKMPEFLTKQMLNRIRFKFQRSDFQPKDNYDDDIVGQIADTVRYYHYDHFNNVRLNNLRTTKNFIFAKDQLKSYGEEPAGNAAVENKDQGKLVHIIFENGTTRFSGEENSNTKSTDTPTTNTTDDTTTKQ